MAEEKVKDKKPKRTHTTIRLDEDIKEYLREKSFSERKSISDIVNECLRKDMMQ